FSTVPCKKSRLDAGAEATLARRHLRPNPGDDADARQPEYRAHVRVDESQPDQLLSFVATARTAGREHGGAVGDPAGGIGASPALRLSESDSRVEAPRDAAQPQTGSADYARGQPVGSQTQAVRDHHGFQPRAGDLSESGAADDANRNQPALGG